MMFTELDSSPYEYKGVFFSTEFEELLSKIVACYNLMLVDDVSLTNDENSIRDVLLLNYLKNNKVRKKIDLMNYHFEREVPEDSTVGRTDIKIITCNTFQDTAAYYTIECKRLDGTNPHGKTGLNAKYIENGVQRFVSKVYTAHYSINGMIGFITHKLDIHRNVEAINLLLTTTFQHVNTAQALTVKKISDFEFSYCSTHNTAAETLTIYHLMFDFSQNVK